MHAVALVVCIAIDIFMYACCFISYAWSQIWIKYAVPFMQKGTLANTLSNVRRCWLAMPLGVGFLRWVLAFCAGCWRAIQ